MRLWIVRVLAACVLILALPFIGFDLIFKTKVANFLFCRVLDGLDWIEDPELYHLRKKIQRQWDEIMNRNRET